MARLAVARHRYDMMWLSRYGVVGTASRQVPNVCKQIVYACRTMSGCPEMAGRIFTHLSQNMYKLPEVVRPYWPSRQVATRCSLFVQNVYTKCLDLSGHTGHRGRSEQLVGTGRATGSPRFLFQPCRAIIMSCRVATHTSRMSCTVLAHLGPCTNTCAVLTHLCTCAVAHMHTCALYVFAHFAYLRSCAYLRNALTHMRMYLCTCACTCTCTCALALLCTYTFAQVFAHLNTCTFVLLNRQIFVCQMDAYSVWPEKNTLTSVSVGLMLYHCLRGRPNIKKTLGRCFVFDEITNSTVILVVKCST